MHCAICFVPPADDALTVAATRWLRRDPYSGARVDSPVEGLVERDHAFVTAAPRRKGFHGCLKPPFRLAPDRSLEDLTAALDNFCRRRRGITVDRVQIAPIQNFFALVPLGPTPDLSELAADFVTAFDAYRSPLTDLDLGRSDIGRLSGRQVANLMAWGHPYVLDQFSFHMTLTGPIDDTEREHVALVLRRHFAGLVERPLQISQAALFVEPEPNAPYLVHSVHEFATQRQRRIA
jgi:hypothetical protein